MTAPMPAAVHNLPASQPPVRAVTAVHVVLRFDEPGGVTVPAPVRKDHVDAVLDVDPHGRPHLPGTSLAGALRAAVADALGPAHADRLFGQLLEQGAGDDEVDDVEVA